MSPEIIFQLHLVLGYVAWLLCFGVYILPRLRSMDRFEAHRASRGDADLGTGARISAHAGLPRLHRKHAKAAQLDAIRATQGLFHPFEDSVHRSLRLGTGQAGALDDTLD